MKKPLYLARNLSELNTRVESKSYGKKLEMLCRVSDTLFLQAERLNEEDVMDEELLYIISSRYINLANMIRMLVKDDKFYATRFAKPLSMVSSFKNHAKQSLEKRYHSDQNVIEDGIEDGIEEVQDAMVALDVESTKSSNYDMFATCNDLFKLITDTEIKLLIIDARSEDDYKESCIKFVSVINIPDNVIRPGLSTNTLQQKLVGNNMEVFKRRLGFDVVIIYDFDTDKLSFPSSKLEELRSILVDWELEENSKVLPLILDGGLRLWTETYPTFVINPSKIFNSYFGKLDDIMMEINYPDYEEVIEQPEKVPIIVDINDYPLTNILQAITTLTEHQVDNEELLLDCTEKRCSTYREMVQSNQPIPMPHIVTKLKNLNNEISKAESFKTELAERRILLDGEYAALKDDMDLSLVADMINTISMFDKKRLARFQTRKKLENKESDLKKILQSVQQETVVAKAPQIPDRKFKPITARKKPFVPSQELYRLEGVTGIKNIKNTCYMNALVQCLRFCPEFAKYMLGTRFVNENFRGNDVSFSRSLSDLMHLLWTDNKPFVHPGSFYIEASSPARRANPFGMGSHEDVQEFFLFMLEVMHNELGVPTLLNDQVSEALRALHKQNFSKLSIISKCFTYQITTTSTCPICKRSILRYEYGNTIFVPLPVDGHYTQIEDSARAILDVNPEEADRNKFCKDCERQRTMKKTVTYYPTVLSLTIVRYGYCKISNAVVRINNDVFFPEEMYFGNQKYELKSIALHVGNKDQGHYTAVCLHSDYNKWYEYNDEKTKQVNITDPIYRVKCYLLFYCLKQPNEEVNRFF